jgi:hypothetical protein
VHFPGTFGVRFERGNGDVTIVLATVTIVFAALVVLFIAGVRG